MHMVMVLNGISMAVGRPSAGATDPTPRPLAQTLGRVPAAQHSHVCGETGPIPTRNAWEGGKGDKLASE